jgi:hypothetical protein
MKHVVGLIAVLGILATSFGLYVGIGYIVQERFFEGEMSVWIAGVIGIGAVWGSVVLVLTGIVATGALISVYRSVIHRVGLRQQDKRMRRSDVIERAPYSDLES